MNVGTYVRRVQSGFGDFNEVAISREEIIDWLNEAQAYVVRETQCIKATLQEAANNFPVIIQDLFLIDAAAYGESLLRFTNTEHIEDWYKTPQRGIPQAYYYDANQIQLWPAPTASDATVVSIRYVASPEILDSGTGDSTELEVPVPFHNDLVIFGLVRAHEKNENYRAAEMKMQEFTANVAHRRFELQHGTEATFRVATLPEDYINDDYHDSLL